MCLWNTVNGENKNTEADADKSGVFTERDLS